MRKLFYESWKNLKPYPVLQATLVEDRENPVLTFPTFDVFGEEDKILAILTEPFLRPPNRNLWDIVHEDLLSQRFCEIAVRRAWYSVAEIIDYGELEWGGIGVILERTEKAREVELKFTCLMEEKYRKEEEI